MDENICSSVRLARLHHKNQIYAIRQRLRFFRRLNEIIRKMEVSMKVGCLVWSGRR